MGRLARIKIMTYVRICGIRSLPCEFVVPSYYCTAKKGVT